MTHWESRLCTLGATDSHSGCMPITCRITPLYDARSTQAGLPLATLLGGLGAHATRVSKQIRPAAMLANPCPLTPVLSRFSLATLSQTRSATRHALAA